MSASKLTNAILNTWQLNNRVTAFLIENLPEELWVEKVPGYRQKTVQMIGGHMHNTRCSWLKKPAKNSEWMFRDMLTDTTFLNIN